jgi:hypothetical protein
LLPTLEAWSLLAKLLPLDELYELVMMQLKIEFKRMDYSRWQSTVPKFKCALQGVLQL